MKPEVNDVPPGRRRDLLDRDLRGYGSRRPDPEIPESVSSSLHGCAGPGTGDGHIRQFCSAGRSQDLRGQERPAGGPGRTWPTYKRFMFRGRCKRNRRLPTKIRCWYVTGRSLFMKGRHSGFLSRGGVWVTAQMLAMTVVLVLGPLFAGRDPSWPGGLLGWFLLGISAVVAVAGTVNLGRNLSPHPVPRAQATLVRHGIYGWVRHPLYLSLMLAGMGWAVLWESLAALVAALVMAFVLDAKSRFEERWLCEKFPEYGEYSRRVRRFLPWIY